MLSQRRLWVLLSQLPKSSRFKSAEAGDAGQHRWSYVEHLLATIADSSQQTNRLLYAEVTHKKPPAFEKHPRPEDDRNTKRDSREDMRDTLAFEHLAQFSPGNAGMGSDSPLMLKVEATRTDKKPETDKRPG